MKYADQNLKTKESERAVIFAAGGIVCFSTQEGPVIAVIHRPKYNDWCLPKGKLKEKESFTEAALREVKEETQCLKPEITSFAGATQYKHEGVPKIVHYWHMTVKERPEFKAIEKKDGAGNITIEVDILQWLSPSEALKKLTHKDERRLLKSVCFGWAPERSGFWTRLYRLFKLRQWTRLAGSLCAYRIELEHRKCVSEATGDKDEYWILYARQLLDRAEHALDKNRIDEGWKCFHAAQRMEIFGLNEEQLKIKAHLLLNESEKLGSWRKKATDELLSGIRCNKWIDKERVYQAALIRDEHFDNQAFKERKLQDYLKLIGIVLFVVVLGILWRVFGIFGSNTALIRGSNQEVMAVLLFGLLGGAVSAAFSVGTNTLKAKIPELTTQTWVNGFRILVGGAAAVVVYIFLKAGLLDIIVSGEIKGIILSAQPYAYLAIAFVAGFSERLVLKTVAAVTKEKKE